MAATTLRPSPTDSFTTPTSVAQSETEAILAKHIPDSSGDSSPALQKNAHMQFLVRNMVQGFPARYTSQDASQPWLLFWTLQAFSTLQVGLDPGNKQRAIDKIMSWQQPDGGFAGGPGQSAHLLPTYASVCALAIVGRPGPGGGWDQIDRERMYAFFMSLKQPDGSFLVARHAEVDVRGIYCLLVTAALLNLLTSELAAGIAAFIASCQTYEGGFGSSSQPYFSPQSALLPAPRPPLGEAHGGYTFCALASWVILQPFLDSPSLSSAPSSDTHSPAINTHTLLRWLVNVQGTEVELGGFKGRTNKLVDGCYSWWCGGAFALLEALGVSGVHSSPNVSPVENSNEHVLWDDVDDSLFNRTALQEYILYACQHPAGGLRDKPPKHADAYHTLYCLAGLSAAQHRVVPSPARRANLATAWVPGDDGVAQDTLRKRIFSDILCWTEEEGASVILRGKGAGTGDNRVNATHPLFALTITHTEALMAHFYGQTQTIPTRAHPRAAARSK